MKKRIAMVFCVMILAGAAVLCSQNVSFGHLLQADGNADNSLVRIFIEVGTGIKEGLQLSTDNPAKNRAAEGTAQMPQIMDVIIDDRKSTALCADGNVWTWKNKQGKAYACRIPGLTGIKQILCAGPALYALSDEGEVYVWGSNELHQVSQTRMEEEADGYYEIPVKIKGLSNIKDIGVSTYRNGDIGVNTYLNEEKGVIFAIDGSGKLFVSGIRFYWEDSYESIKDLPGDCAELVKNVDKVCTGSGNNHYFIREDGTVFSIMELEPYAYEYEVKNCILPVFGRSEKIPWDSLNWIELTVDAVPDYTVLHEMGDGEGVEDMTADQYTMFLYKEDHTLWYWDNKLIPYHDCRMNERPEDGIDDYSGKFKEVDIEGILETEGSPGIRDMCAGKENVLFLTEDGQVFISRYITTEIWDREETELYYYTASQSRWVPVPSAADLEIKDITFQKLGWENIISINTDGEFQFSAVDREGNCYHLCTEEDMTGNM